MIGGYNASSGPELYAIEPSGVSWGYFGYAAGKARTAATAELEKLKLADLNVEQAVLEAARM